MAHVFGRIRGRREVLARICVVVLIPDPIIPNGWVLDTLEVESVWCGVLVLEHGPVHRTGKRGVLSRREAAVVFLPCVVRMSWWRCALPGPMPRKRDALVLQERNGRDGID